MLTFKLSASGTLNVKIYVNLSFTSGTSLVAQTVKRLPTMRETWVQSLGQEDPLEEVVATNSSIFT